jgi:DNA-binding NtrC family response regulator
MEETPIKILLVDDDEEYLAIAKHYLRSFHHRSFEVEWAVDEAETFRKLRANPAFDVILMDYYLPETNGLDITRRIFDAKFNVPVILLTANKDFRIAIEAMKFGVEEYLVKEQAVDTILPRTVINVLERVHLKKRILEVENTKKKAEAIQELIVTMCHEFNNPLAAIKISSDILSRQQIGDHHKEILETLNKNISLLEKQIVKLRDFNVEKQE